MMQWNKCFVLIIVGALGLVLSKGKPAAGTSSRSKPLPRITHLGGQRLYSPIELPPSSWVAAVSVSRTNHFLTGSEQCHVFWIVLSDLDRQRVEDFYRTYIKKHYPGCFVRWGRLLRPGTKEEKRAVFVFRDRSFSEELLFILIMPRASPNDPSMIGLGPEAKRKTLVQIALPANDLLTDKFKENDFVIPIPR